MLFALGAASVALDAVQSLASSASSLKPSSGSASGFGQTSPFEISSPALTAANSSPATTGFSAGAQIAPATMQALLAAQSQSTTTSASSSQSDALQNLFSRIDANGDGQITKSEFGKALGAGGSNTAASDGVFGKLDSNGDGSVSLGELSAALKGKGGHHGHHHAAGSSGSTDPSTDPLLQALQGSSSTSAGSGSAVSSASLTPADRSSVTATSLVPGGAASSYSSLEQMFQRQTQALSFSAQPLSFNA